MKKIILFLIITFVGVNVFSQGTTPCIWNGTGTPTFNGGKDGCMVVYHASSDSTWVWGDAEWVFVGGDGSATPIADEVMGLETKIRMSKSKQKTIRVAWIGDSNSANEYPSGINALFLDTLYSSFHSVDLRNRSRSGYTLKAHWQSISVRSADTLNAGNITDFQPDIICISLGTNDVRTNAGNIAGTAQLDSTSYVNMMRDVLSYYLDSTSAHVIIMSSAPIGYPASGLVIPNDSLSVIGKNAVLRAATGYFSEKYVNGRVSVCNGYDFLFPSNYVISDSTYLVDDLHASPVTVREMFRAMQYLLTGSYTNTQQLEEWNRAKPQYARQDEIWRTRPDRIEKGNYVLIHKTTNIISVVNKPSSINTSRIDRYVVALGGDTSLANNPTFFQKGDIVRFGNTRAYKIDSLYHATTNVVNYLLGFFTVQVSDSFNFTGSIEVWRDMDFSDNFIPKTSEGFYLAGTVPSVLTIGTATVNSASNLHIVQTTGKVPLSITGSLGGNLVTITGSGNGHTALTLLSNSSQSTSLNSTSTRTDTYRFQTDVRPNVFEHSNSVDSYTITGVYGSARQNRTTKGVETNLAIGGDFFASSAITSPVGNYGAAGRFTAQTSNVNVLRLNGHSSQLVPILSAYRGVLEVFRIDSIGRIAIMGDQPSYVLDIYGTDAIRTPRGTTAQRPIGAAGTMRYNSTWGGFDVYTIAQRRLVDMPDVAPTDGHAAVYRTATGWGSEAIPTNITYGKLVLQLSQGGTNDPTATTVLNTTGRTYTLARTGVGVYTITMSGATGWSTAQDHSFGQTFPSFNVGSVVEQMDTGTNIITIRTFSDGLTLGTPADGMITTNKPKLLVIDFY